MKKKLVVLGFLLILTNIRAQVGINTETPKTTLDVNAKRDTGGNITDNTQTYGLQAPRFTRAELTANTATYGADQKGALVYITDVTGGTAAGQRANIIDTGYYYFDGTIWMKIGSGGTEPWNIQNTTTPATANTQNVYQNGKVAIGFTNADAVSSKQLEVKGDLKATYGSGSFYSGINTNATELGQANILYISDNANLNAATKTSAALLMQDIANLQASNSDGQGSIAAFSNSGGGTVGFVANKSATDVTSSIWGYSNNSLSYVQLSHQKSGKEATNVTLEKQKGVSFDFKKTADGSQEGNYTFPRNNGVAGQVLTTDGNNPSAQLSWTTPALTAIPGTWGTVIKDFTSYGTGTPKNISLYTGHSITLPPGKWLVLFGDMASLGDNTAAGIGYLNINTTDAQLWCTGYLTDGTATSTVTADYISAYGGQRGSGGSIGRGMNRTFVSGAVAINNTTGGYKIYYLWANQELETHNSTVTQINLNGGTTAGYWKAVFGLNWERYFYAVPVQ